MKSNSEKLTEFHRKHSFPVGVSLTTIQPGCLDENYEASAALRRAAGVILGVSAYLEMLLSSNKDVRLVRAQLGAEEMGELIHALAHKDELGLLDALADTQYINEGTAVTYGFPLQSAFDVVHDSNMTKAARNPDDPRLRDKGESYVPAEEGLRRLLEK